MSIAASWIQLTEYNNNFFYYRRNNLYNNISTAWCNEQGIKPKDFNLASYEIVICPFGGPIAMFKKPSSSMLFGEGSSSQSALSESQMIYIYSAACKYLRKIDQSKEEPLLGIGWTDDMKFMVLTKKRLLLYNVFNGERYAGPWQNEDIINNDKKSDNNSNKPHLPSTAMDKLSTTTSNKKKDDPSHTNTSTDTTSTFISVPLQAEEEIKAHAFFGEGCAVFTSKRRLLVAYDLSEAKPFHEYIFPKTGISQNADLSQSVMTVVPNYELSVRKKKPKVEGKKKAGAASDGPHDHDHEDEEEEDDSDDDEEDEKTSSSSNNTSPKLAQSSGPITKKKSGFFGMLARRNARALNNGASLGSGGGGIETKSFKVGKGPLVLFCTPDKMTIIMCYSNLYKDMKLDERLKGNIQEQDTSGFTKIALSPDLKTVAAFHQASGHLFVFDLALTSNYLKFFTGITEHRLDQLVYCGGESMMLYWSPENIGGGDQSLVLLVNCFGHYESFTFDGPIVLSQEIDCVRFVTSNSVEFIERIPESIVEVFRIGSLSPAALLYDAYSDFVNERATCLKTIREIKNKELGEQSIDALSDGVNKCIDAACREFDTNIQAQLLKAAIYGKNFMKTSIDEAKAFQTKCKYIRLMNELRNRSEFPITYEQIIALTPQVLVQRLSEMHEFLLAYKICDYLNLSKAKVLEHWAKTKIRSQMEEKDEASQMKLRDRIIENLGKFSTSVSFSNIAMEAYKVQKPKLAKALLEVDSNPHSQIKLYLSMHETLSALEKAQQSNDTDLLYVVILYLIKFFDTYYMFEMIADKKAARKLFISYCTHLGKFKKLEKFYKYLKSDHNEDAASRENGFVQLRHAFKNYDSPDDDAEKRYAYYLEKSEKYFNERSTDKLDAEFSLKSRELYGLQMKLEEETDEEFIGATLQDTLYRVMISPTLREKKGERKKYVKILKKNFGVSDKRYYFSKIKALVHLGEWKKLETFANSKKSPVGYIPFVEECLASPKPEEALKFIPMIESVETKVEYWINMLKFKEAIEAAFEARDVDLLEYIKKKTKNSKTKDTIDQCIQQLNK